MLDASNTAVILRFDRATREGVLTSPCSAATRLHESDFLKSLPVCCVCCVCCVYVCVCVCVCVCHRVYVCIVCAMSVCVLGVSLVCMLRVLVVVGAKA